jgi:hypothetical protein
MSGRALFNLWVNCGLCFDAAYTWEMLSPEKQRRWDDMANRLRGDKQ